MTMAGFEAGLLEKSQNRPDAAARAPKLACRISQQYSLFRAIGSKKTAVVRAFRDFFGRIALQGKIMAGVGPFISEMC